MSNKLEKPTKMLLDIPSDLHDTMVLMKMKHKAKEGERNKTLKDLAIELMMEGRASFQSKKQK